MNIVSKIYFIQQLFFMYILRYNKDALEKLLKKKEQGTFEGRGQ